MLDDARAALTAHAITLPVAGAADPAPRCRRITGALAASARIAGTLGPRPDLVVTGVAEGTRVTVEPDVRTGCVAIAVAPAGVAKRHDATRVSIAALRSPFVLSVTPAGAAASGARSQALVPAARSRSGVASAGDPAATPGHPASAPVARSSSPPPSADALDAPSGLEVSVAGEVAVRGLAYDDVTVGAASGSFALGVAPEARLDAARAVATGIHRAGRLLGDVRVDLARRGARFDVAVTARPAAGLVVSTAAVVTPNGARYLAALGASRIALPDGTVWTGRGGSITLSSPAEPARLFAALRGLSLRRGDAVVALSGDYAGTGDLAAHVAAEHVDASWIDAAARGTGRVTLDVARRGGRWQASGAVAATGFAATAEATPVDVTAQVALVRGQATLEAHAAGPALGAVDLVLAAAAPRDPLDLAAWRTLDRDAIRTAAITARRVSLPGLPGLAGRGAGAPAGTLAGAPAGMLAGTVDGELDLAPAALRGALAVRGVSLPLGTIDSDIALAPEDGDLAARAAVRLVGVAGGEATVRLTVPRHPFDPATWRRRGRDLVRAASVTLADVAFDPALLARLGIAPRLAARGLAADYRGHAAARFTLGAAAAEAHLAVDVTGVTGGALVSPVSPHVALDTGPAGTHLRAELAAATGRGNLALGALDADVPVTLDGWIDQPAAILDAPVTATWILPPTPAPAVLALVGRRE
ncbi:MAG TPA: hypothetical protein VGD37_16775, partial [Kofleriaceae bacterium]